MKMKRWNTLVRGVAAGAAVLGMLFAEQAAAADPVKMAWVYVGPPGDGGWTYAHDVGRKEVEKKFGSKVQTSFVENVPESADAERVIRELAQKGNGIIFT